VHVRLVQIGEGLSRVVSGITYNHATLRAETGSTNVQEPAGGKSDMSRGRVALFILVALVASTGSARAGFFDIALNDHSVDAWGGTHLGSDPEARVSIGGRAVYDDDRNTRLGAFYAGFGGKPGSAWREITVGIQAFAGKGRDENVAALALGVQARFTPERWHGAFVGGRIFYAPDLLAWSDCKRLADWAVRGGYRFGTRIYLFAEYQRITADLKTAGSKLLAGNAMAGFGAEF
jgi:hypothetical protein